MEKGAEGGLSPRLSGNSLSRGVVFVWACIWVSDLILGAPLEYYVCLILGACVINSSLANGLIGKSDASALFTAIVVVVVIFYMAVPLYWSALVADAVLLGYASLTLTREDMLVAVPALLVADTVFIRTLRYPAIRSPLIAALHIGVGTPLVAISRFRDFGGAKDAVEDVKKTANVSVDAASSAGATPAHTSPDSKAPGPKRKSRLSLEISDLLGAFNNSARRASSWLFVHASSLSAPSTSMRNSPAPAPKNDPMPSFSTPKPDVSRDMKSASPNARSPIKMARRKPESPSPLSGVDAKSTAGDASWVHVTSHKIKFRVQIKAENLVPKSRWRGTSDPYVKMVRGSRTVGQTEVLNDSLNPSWQPVDLAIRGLNKRPIELLVFHVGVVAKYLLGRTVFRVPNMKRLPYELNLALMDELGKPVTFNGEPSRVRIRLAKARPRPLSLGIAGGNLDSRILSAPAAVLEQQISSARSFVDDREQPNEDSNPRAKLAYERCRHGTPAYKHSTRGRKERWIQLSDDSSALNWMSADRKKKRGFIPLLSVVRVSSGCQTSVFRRAISAGSIDATADAESRCFSLVCRDKSLDLEVASAASREQWVADLRLIAGLMPADGEQ